MSKDNSKKPRIKRKRVIGTTTPSKLWLVAHNRQVIRAAQ